MSSDVGSGLDGRRERSGPIAYMASNGIAANLPMMGIIAAGLVSLTGIDREASPTTPFYLYPPDNDDPRSDRG